MRIVSAYDRAVKYPDHAARGERCPWCKNLKHGRCTGCGQQYGEPDDTTGSTARRVTQKAGDALSPPPVPPVEVPASSQANATGEASAKTPAQPVALVLPEPPSANVWWRRHGSVMHLSHDARDYKADVALRAGVNGKPIFPDQPLTIVIVWRRARKSGDLDKRLGVLLDALQSWTDTKGLRHPGVYENDAQIVQIWARRCDEHPDLAPGMVRVEVSATA